jgi:hypothetical protein
MKHIQEEVGAHVDVGSEFMIDDRCGGVADDIG